MTNKKIKNISDLRHLFEKDLKNSIILCHGVFELLHIGHIKYFEEAKSMGDTLVVTLTPDKFVNKGAGRPVFDQNLRSQAIAALECVDYVAINEWPTAVETIEKIKPKFYVKGPDYKNSGDDITGNIKYEQHAVEKIGGKIVFTKAETYSSSNLLNNFFSNFNQEQKLFLNDLKRSFTISEIRGSLDQLREKKILLVGETILDEYIFCDSVGKSGKEPVLVSKKLRTEKFAGGVLSVANHLSDFCNKVKVLTYLGDRDTQEDFIKENIAKNVELDFIKKHKSPTILKTRYIDDYTKTKVQGIYDLNDENLNSTEEKEFLSKIGSCISEFDVVIVVDYGHGLITPKAVELLENKSEFLAVNTQLNSFNSSFHSISKYNNADYICVHSGELRHDYRNRNDSIDSLIKKLYKSSNAKFVTITLGNKGAMVFNGEKFVFCPAFSQKVVDRVGAGDTLLAITSVCFGNSIDDRITLLLGNLSAAETVATAGTGNRLNKVKLLKTVETLLK